ncbi:MAG TPA: phytanoyl-CoA dioxygenase family protein [Gammaproteobacteria bacterium]|nr:phytanoyl-CoA dioxygenase family protein [Gammaproteobacteria bacterium]
MSQPSFVLEFPLFRRILGRIDRLKAQAYQRYRERRFPAAVYDALYYVRNLEPVERYRQAQAKLAPQPIEAKVLQDLREHGLAVVDIADLLQVPTLEQIQAWAEQVIAAPSNQAKISFIEGGGRPDAMSGKFYLVRLLGDEPFMEFNNPMTRLSLSAEVLRIVAAYFGMFGRLAALGLWYNLPTGGPAMFSQRWHRDPEDKRLVKTFLYLRDVGETNGPFSYVLGSHNDGPLKHVRPESGRMYPEPEFVDKHFPPHLVRVCTGKAGTLIFADTTGFHRGGQPTSGARLLFNTVYTSNASIPLVLKRREFRMTGSPESPLDELASYAVGHLASTREITS